MSQTISSLCHLHSLSFKFHNRKFYDFKTIETGPRWIALFIIQLDTCPQCSLFIRSYFMYYA